MSGRRSFHGRTGLLADPTLLGEYSRRHARHRDHGRAGRDYLRSVHHLMRGIGMPGMPMVGVGDGASR